MRSRSLTLLALTGVVVVAVTAWLAWGPGVRHSAATPALSDWGPCPSADAPSDGVQCATITVPFDYAHPDGETFTIPVARIASKADHPQLLIMNPGGPGISGVKDLLSGREYYEKFTDVYTVVSFDPRGVGGSSPAVSCLDDELKAAIFDQPSVPRSAADQQRRQDLAARIGNACSRQFGPALEHLGTENVAGDMDAIRAALGFDKTSYLGYSYGTFVGALYAQMFPQRTGRGSRTGLHRRTAWSGRRHAVQRDGVRRGLPAPQRLSAAGSRAERGADDRRCRRPAGREPLPGPRRT
jgi:pimeloyl-ACP methyl ester carboxylesterase